MVIVIKKNGDCDKKKMVLCTIFFVTIQIGKCGSVEKLQADLEVAIKQEERARGRELKCVAERERQFQKKSSPGNKNLRNQAKRLSTFSSMWNQQWKWKV